MDLITLGEALIDLPSTQARRRAGRRAGLRESRRRGARQCRRRRPAAGPADGLCHQSRRRCVWRRHHPDIRRLRRGHVAHRQRPGRPDRPGLRRHRRRRRARVLVLFRSRPRSGPAHGRTEHGRARVRPRLPLRQHLADCAARARHDAANSPGWPAGPARWCTYDPNLRPRLWPNPGDDAGMGGHGVLRGARRESRRGRTALSRPGSVGPGERRAAPVRAPPPAAVRCRHGRRRTAAPATCATWRPLPRPAIPSRP